MYGKLINKDYNWWIELPDGKQIKVNYIKVFNSSDYYVRYKGKKYGVELNLDDRIAKIEIDREII